MENLLELRNEIDAIDKEIVGLFQKRMKYRMSRADSNSDREVMP